MRDMSPKQEDPEMILVSACLLGIACRYDGRSYPAAGLRDLGALGRLLPFCPEVAGGLTTPRPPAEIKGAHAGLDGHAVLDGRSRVMGVDGTDVTVHFAAGAEAALALARRMGIRRAILKAGSPSCGAGRIAGGAFDGTLVPGDGVTAALLKRAEIQVITEEDLVGGEM
jgi:uncharacterized protein YbbK (DUF523 family)